MKHLINIEDLTIDEINQIYTRASEFEKGFRFLMHRFHKEDLDDCAFPELFLNKRLKWNEKTDLKGKSVGGAQVSEKHAGFVINRFGGTASDVLELMEHIKNTVKTEKTDAEINKIATDAGLTKEQTEFVRKTLSNDIYKEDGSLNSEKITEEIKKVGQLFGVELKGNVGYSGKDDNGNKKLELESELDRLRKKVGLIK